MANTVKQAFNALTPQQQEIVRTRRFSGARTPDEWIALLGPVAEYDRHADQVRQGGGGFFARRYARKNDVPNGLRTFAFPLLAILREDIEPGAPLELWVDLSGPLQSGKATRSTPPYKKPPYRKIVDTFYDDIWLQGRTRFADGSRLQFAVIDHVRSTFKEKKNPRGKIKRKTKNKKKTELTVTLTASNRMYAKTAGGRAAPKVKLKPADKHTKVTLGGTLVAPNMEAVPQLESLIELISGAYERVAPARRKKL
ncbi:hypothetical protein DVA67_006315 [Solirubrobacter sp. CPCC 204708]|uniref:Transposase n=1 Tax=Solirubrobacter deserti TaxID=2282478 RepID=A0ABT4RCH0_9ACTN|nr:hypothetical protein [Solirubrobacter deserti]MBE2315581.1 hypothetical protein [Solirubrobacter deserti]MDA0136220.1 hypothetical protein [Solirubrobacter deserti]